MAKRNGWSNQGRFDGMSGLISMSLAVILSVGSITVAAQTVFEFEDPLEQTRAAIERSASETEASPAPASKPEPISSNANVGPTTDAKGPITVFAERLGLPTAGLVGLGVLALLALLLGLMWLIGRRKSARTSQRTDRALYAVSDGARGRRMLESGAKVTRNRKEFLDTTEESEISAKPSVARKAAKILSDGVDADDHQGDDEDDYRRAFEAEAKPAVAAKAAKAAAVTTTAAVASNPDDPSTWRRPNLDRLKESIRNDWKSNEEAPLDTETKELRDEAKVFADLFGDDAPSDAAQPATAKTTSTKSPVLDMLDTFEEDREPMSVSSLQAAVEKTADVQPTAKKARADSTDRADALRRIKALRESVKAS